LANVFGYGEIRERHLNSRSTLMSAFSALKDPHFISVTVSSREEVYPALRRFFSTKGESPDQVRG